MSKSPFSEQLIAWYSANKRDLPWRQTRDPYPIWLSETILQQTRVAQGLPYYERFLNTFPNLADLARADDDDVMKLWQGLGYYSRARNMLKTARKIHFDLKNKWPKSSFELQKLPGIGPYTAAAIASFAFDESTPVIDGNVNRVITRYLDIEEDLSNALGQNAVRVGLNELFDPAQHEVFNQAIMELGAMICTPKKPLCEECPIADSCRAKSRKTVFQRPVKSSKTKVQNRYLDILVIENGGNVAMINRPDRGIWRKLWTFPIVENETPLTSDQIKSSPEFTKWLSGLPYRVHSISDGGIHLLSHRRLHLRFWKIAVENCSSENDAPFRMVSWDEVHTFAVPKPIESFIKNRLK